MAERQTRHEWRKSVSRVLMTFTVCSFLFHCLSFVHSLTLAQSLAVAAAVVVAR